MARTCARPRTATVVSRAEPLPDADFLREVELDVVGRFTTASNATLLVRLKQQDGSWPELPSDEGGASLTALSPWEFAVYKPLAGEAPLWDFPEGTLHRREVAAFEVDRLLGWDLVPLTVLRDDAPHGVGSLQRYVPHDPAEHYFTLLEEGRDAIVAQLQRMVLLDLIIDNADRKGGHVLLEGDRVRLVDHGVSFNIEPKVRTVAWHFAGEPVPASDRQAVASLAGRLHAGIATPALEPLLFPDELARLIERVDAVARMETFPEPAGPRPYPWPLI